MNKTFSLVPNARSEIGSVKKEYLDFQIEVKVDRLRSLIG